MNIFTDRIIRLAMLNAIIAASVCAVDPASAQSLQDLRAALPGLAIRPSKEPGAFDLGGEFRTSKYRSTRGGFEVSLHWNGVDDSDWPLERIVSGLASRRCGPVSRELALQQIERLYKSKSLIRGKELGGNAGETFKRRISANLGRCSAVYQAEGARWHTIFITVSSK